jgi:hypothetical protein
LVAVELPYLFCTLGRHKHRPYWFYRRDGRYIAIKSSDGRRLQPSDDGFLEAYRGIHERFQQPPAAPARPATKAGTMAHLIETYRAAPEFKQRSAKTQKDYGRYLDVLKKEHGHRSMAKLPRDAVFAIRDAYQETPRTANYIVSVLRLLLSFAEDRKQTFGLPPNWINPARRPKNLETGDGLRRTGGARQYPRGAPHS